VCEEVIDFKFGGGKHENVNLARNIM
jgi:hypothetical protein